MLFLSTLASMALALISRGLPLNLNRIVTPTRYCEHRLKLAAAVGLVEALGVFIRGFLPGFSTAAQGAGEGGWAFFAEGLAAFLPLGRGLDQEGVDQVLDLPGLVGRQVAEADHELLHHANCDRG